MFLNKISEQVNEFRILVLAEIRRVQSFLFSQFVKGRDSLEKAQFFIYFLFLAMEGTVILDQTESEDILISGVPVTTV